MATNYEIVRHLNNVKFSNVSTNMKNVLRTIHNREITDDTIIFSYVNTDNTEKTDITISIEQNNYNINLLSGHYCSVHEASRNDFLDILRTFNAPNEVVTFINNLCTADMNTTDFINSVNVDIVNQVKAFFNNPDIKKHIITEALKTGFNTTAIPDYIYHGNVNSGIICNIDVAINIICDKVARTSLIPIGNLALQRKDWRTNQSIQLKWHHPDEDLA